MLLMEQFYHFYLKEGLALPEALRRAQVWLREVTAGELAERFTAERQALLSGSRLPGQIVSKQFRRFNAMESTEHPFAHPYYWAAFTFSGV